MSFEATLSPLQNVLSQQFSPSSALSQHGEQEPESVRVGGQGNLPRNMQSIFKNFEEMKRKRRAHEMEKISWSDDGENLFSLIKEKKRGRNSDNTPDFVREEHHI